MRIVFLRPVLFAERRFDQGVTVNVSPEIGGPLVRAGVARDADAPKLEARDRPAQKHKEARP